MDPHLSGTLEVSAFFALVGFIAWLIAKHAQARREPLRQHYETRNRLLERFQTPQELLEFARTEEGRSLLDAPPSPRDKRPAAWFLLLLSGLISLAAGSAFCQSYSVITNYHAANLHFLPGQEFYLWQSATNDFFYGSILTRVGFALLACSAISGGAALWNRRKLKAEDALSH